MVVDHDAKGRERYNATRQAGSGNSHTLAPVDLKLLQLTAVVAAAQLYFGTVGG